MRSLVSDIVSTEQHLAARGASNPGNNVDQRGFPRAIWTDQTDDFALIKIQSYVIKSANAAKCFADLLKLEECGHGRCRDIAFFLAQLSSIGWSRTLSKPPGNKKITITITAPKIARLYSRKFDQKISSRNKKAAVPTIGPKTVPAPPNK